MQRSNDFTTGKILGPLIRFMVPVFLAMLLQAMYGAVDLLIVGQFAQSLDVSAVSTGSQMMMTITNLVTSFAMGATILLGQRIGEGRGRVGGEVVGSSICLFGVIAIGFTLMVPLLCRPLSSVMNAPEEAFDATASYIRICGIHVPHWTCHALFHGDTGHHVPDLFFDRKSETAAESPPMRMSAQPPATALSPRRLTAGRIRGTRPTESCPSRAPIPIRSGHKAASMPRTRPYLQSSATIPLIALPSALPFRAGMIAFMICPLFFVARSSAQFAMMKSRISSSFIIFGAYALITS